MNLNDKYRPQAFDEVVGHTEIINSLKSAISNNVGSTFILHGESGLGKTTLARIFAKEVGCTELIEKDAASNSGKDHIKDVIKSQDYYVLNGGSRVFIIDECHGLSKAAWDVLLKTTEEVPESNYWFFCTTEINKIPKTIRTRSNEFKFNPVKPSDISKLLHKVRASEGLDVLDENIEIITQACEGSPRKSLKMMESSIGLTKEMLSSLILNEDTTESSYNLAKSLNDIEFDLSYVISICRSIKNQNPEMIRQTVRAYFTTICLNNPNSSWSKTVLSEFEPVAVEQNKITDIIMRVFRLHRFRSSNKKT